MMTSRVTSHQVPHLQIGPLGSQSQIRAPDNASHMDRAPV